MKNNTLTPEQIAEIEYFGEATFNGDNYKYKDYLYKSEIYKNDELIIRINNKLSSIDPNRIEYV